MSLRDSIRRSLPIALLGSYSADRIADEIHQRVIDAYGVDPDAARSTVTITAQPEGIDQGVSRLALRAFVQGLPDRAWNGSDEDGGSSQWVRYRGHVIDRESSEDGWTVGIMYYDHDNRTMYARFPGGDGADTNTGIHVDQRWTADAILAIDDLIDDVIAVHGIPSEDDLPHAEIVEP
jgi:hypothetical protein